MSVDEAKAVLERPLPKPKKDLVSYAATRVLEALFEAILALEFLERGYTRSAAGKMFQAWRALTAALLALERDKIAGRLGGEERRWFEERAIPRVPGARLKPLARLVEEAAGIPYYLSLTDTALSLHDYQYHGPDPSGEFSRYPDRAEAGRDIVYLAGRLADIVEGHVKPKLESLKAWSQQHAVALRRLRESLKQLRLQ